MSDNRLVELCERVASTVVIAQVDDQTLLLQLAADLRQFEKLLTQDDEMALDLVGQCQSLLARILEETSQNPAADLALIVSITTKLQDCILNPSDYTHAPDESDAMLAQPALQAEDGVFVLDDFVDEEIFIDFLAKREHFLEDFEKEILELEKGSLAGLSQLKRLLHNLKGEAGLLGMQDLAQVCQSTEDWLEQSISIEDRIDPLLAIKDWIAQALDSYAQYKVPKPSADELMVQIQTYGTHVVSAEDDNQSSGAQPEEQQSQPDEPTSEADIESADEIQAVDIDWDEETLILVAEFLDESFDGLVKVDDVLLSMEKEGADLEKVNELFRVFHTIKGVSGFLEFDQITELAHTTETLLNQARNETLEMVGPILDLVFDATELMRQMMNGVRDAANSQTGLARYDALPPLLENIQAAQRGELGRPEAIPIVEAGTKLGSILQLSGRVEKDDVQKAVEQQQETGLRIGEQLLADGVVKPKQVAHALRAQTNAEGGNQKVRVRETVKVDLARVDHLVEMIGELVIVESMLSHAPEVADLGATRVQNYMNQLSKSTRDLQDIGMRMRMVPVRGVFQKMARMVRDLSKKLSKDIVMVQSGEGTEIDRSMVEHISDPMVHMIRNAVDHGIETPEDRKKTNKSKQATVRLSAYHRGGSIVIEVADDGQGLDPKTLRIKAIERGLVRESDNLTEQEIYNLIFSPGFSTSKQVTEISGRGVGMDVVRRNIETLRGRVSINSVPGHGCTFEMVLPLTLAIIDGMIVACGKDNYIIPTLSIVESIQPDASMMFSYADKGEMVNIRGEILPLYRLDGLFGIKDAKSDPTEALVVVVESAQKKIGLLVDDVLTQQQVVIKTLASSVPGTEFLSGAAILSDGRVGLILNMDEICNLVDTEPNRVQRCYQNVEQSLLQG